MVGAWDGIEEFVAVAQTGSFTAGAISHRASVTHMSRSVSRLEARLATRLFNRTTRSLSLTETGRIFLERCRRLIEERDEAIGMIAAQVEPRGTLRLTCSYALGEQFIAPLLREFAKCHPKLSVEIDLENDVVDIITSGYDLAVRTGHLEDSRMIATRVAQRELVTVATPAYLSVHGKPVTVAELAKHNCLTGSASRWHFCDGEVFQPNGRWRCNSGRSVLDACLDDMGICQLPAFYLGSLLTEGTLCEILKDRKPADEPIWAVYPTRRHLSPKVSQFVALLRDRLQAILTKRNHETHPRATL